MAVWTVKGGRLWDGTAFKANDSYSIEVAGSDEERVISLEDDDILFQGFLDVHTHLWTPDVYDKLSFVSAAQLMAYGVAGCIDMGSYGYSNFDKAATFWKASIDMPIKAYLNVRPEGHVRPKGEKATRPEDIDEQKLIDMIQKYPRLIRGIKIHGGAGMDAASDIGTLEIARRVCDKTGVRLSVHTTRCCVSMGTIASYMKAGDEIIHIYQGFGGNALGEDGIYGDDLVEARKRGILTDNATGFSNFSWKVFDKAMERGFLADFHANDMTYNTFMVPTRNSDMPRLLSNMVFNGGIALEEMMTALTTRAADFMGINYDFPENLVVLKLVHEPFDSIDPFDVKRTADRQYKAQTVVLGGKVYREQL